MTIDTLKGVRQQLQDQYTMVQGALPKSDKPVVAHMNSVELLGAIQLCNQLIQQEEIVLQAPPGATGPVL